jgi:hypothetical protein
LEEKPDGAGTKGSEIETVTYDPEDIEDESVLNGDGDRKVDEEESVTPRVIKVKVPKVKSSLFC